jgi:uncharacterized repeat protein (TIGR01451 family)
MKPTLFKRFFPSFCHARAGGGARWWLHRLVAGLLIGLPLQAGAVDLLVSNLTDTPDPAIRGGNIVYAASVTNNTTDIATNVAVVFSLHAQTTFVAVNDAACAYAAGPNTVTCSYPTLKGDVNGPGTADVKNINVTVRSLAGNATTVNFIATVSSSDTDSNPGNDSLTQTTTIDNGADLAIVLSGNPASVMASGNVVYTAATTNNGPNVAGATTVSTTLSPNLSYVSASGTGWSCAAAAQVVSCTRASAALGAQPAITINTKVTGAVVGTISNSAVVSISGSATDYNSTNDLSVVNTTVTGGTDLAVTKTVSAPTIGGGQPVSFTLAPRNLGPFTASAVVVTDSVPTGFSAISASGAGWTCNVVGNDVSCSRASYAVGSANNITVLATAPLVPVAVTFTNSTTIGSSTPDGVAGNNSGTVNVTIVPDGVDLSITKARAPNPVAEGGNITSTMRVTNHGPRAAAAGEVSIVDTLPAGETYVGKASGADWSCSAAGQLVTCLYTQPLALNASTSFIALNTTASAAGTLTNTACAVYTSPVLSDPVASNNCASASVVATPGPASIDLQLLKVADTAVLAWNDSSITYTLTVTNLGPGTATGVVLADPIPGHVAGKTVVSASRTGGTSVAPFSCTTGATVTCTQTGGSIAPAESAIFTVVVSRPLNDSLSQAGLVWTNTASVSSNAQGDTNPANNTASASVRVEAVADIAVFNAVNPTSAIAGTNAIYVLTINNNGPSRADNVSISDVFTMASGTMTFISATPSAGSCAAFNTATQTLNCNVGNLVSGGTATVTVVVRPDYMIAPPSPREIFNTAVVATTTQESSTANNSAASTLVVSPASLDLLINSSDNIDPLGFVSGGVAPDNIVTYRNIITNRGPSVASSLKLTFVMNPPAGKTMTFLGDKLTAAGAYVNYCDNLNAGVTGPAQLTITCHFPAAQILLSNNATTDLLLDFRVDTQPNSVGDTYLSSVAIEAAEPELTTANNFFNQSTTIKMRVDLQMAKSARAHIGGADAAATVLDVRQPFYWVLTLTNAGPGDSQVTTITDTLPAGLSLYAGNAIAPYNAAPYNTGLTWSSNNATPTSGVCSGTATISCNIGLLENGKVATVFIPVVRNTFSGSQQNCASATTSEVDSNPANNTACATVSYQRSSIAGTVYADGNNDGLKGGAEAGIAGVSMLLNGTDNYGNVLTNLAATTDASGNYVFSDRSAGNYAISELQPAAYLDGKEAAGTSAGTATDATGDSISAIALPLNTAATGYLFGEVLPATVSGFIFIDRNADAVRNVTGVPATDESAGLTSVGLTLTGNNDLGPVNLTVNSGINGAYSFTGLRPGTYQVLETTLGGVTHTGMTIGSNGGNDGATALAANTAVPGLTKHTVSNIVLAAGAAAINYNFGESGQGLGGVVYADANNNGIKDAGEPGIGGVSITLSGNTSGGQDVCVAISPNPCTIQTDASGGYTFAGLPASSAAGYTLTEQSQASAPLSGYGDGIDSLGSVNGVASGAMSNDKFTGIVIAAGTIGTAYNFGEIAASIAGKVYLDVDRSNTLNAADTPIAGVTVTLSGTAANGANVCTLLASCVGSTDAAGNFSFIGLPASNASGYSVTETQPGDYVDAANTPGTGATAAGTASVVGGNTVFGAIVLGAGQAGVNYLYGEAAGSISGVVYHDANNDGIKGAGESGVAGATITLTGTAAGGGTPCGLAACVTTSAADGSYTFNNVRNANVNAGGYTLTETQPAAYLDGKVRKGTIGGAPCAACVDSVPNVIGNLPFNAANGALNFNFGELLAARIDGRVYLDMNDDASFGAGEQLAGVTLTLSGTNDLGAALNLSTTTAADGSYQFTGLRPSNGAGYSVTETHPAAYSDFPGASGTQPGTVNGALTGTASPNAISGIVIASNGAGAGYNFREIGASISGVVYFDADSNNIRNGGEQGVSGIIVKLSGPSSRTAVTDANGAFSFTGLAAGSYALAETQPGAYADGADQAGSAGGTINAPKNSIVGIALAPGAAATGYLFGEKAIPFVDGSIEGKVYVDSNKNGVRDQDELPLAGVTISLSGTDHAGRAVELSVQTDANGNYLFPTVRAGSYTLTESQPAHYQDFAGATGTTVGTIAGGSAALNSVTSVAMPSTGGKASAYDFRELPPASTARLGGLVYVDVNQNGKPDAGEALAKVLVTIDGIDAFGNPLGARSVMTGADGSYLFDGLPAGTFFVVETQPAAFGDFPANTGSALGNAGGVLDAGPNKIGTIVLAAAFVATDYNFREKPARLTGFVYRDDNDNGVKEAGEAGLPGVHVTLSGTLSGGGDVCAMTSCVAVTGADGLFAFNNVLPGNYTLVETQTDLDTARIADGKESAGVAGGKVDNSAYGTAPSLNTIAGLKITAELLAANNGLVDGYLFGERVRTGPVLMPPIVSGHVWLDLNHTRVRPQDGSNSGQKDWTVTLSQNGKPICTVITDANGFYQFDNLRCAGYQATGLPTGSGFEIGFTKDGNNMPNVATSGGGVGESAVGKIGNITLKPADELTEQNLPLDPSGIVYDSATRQPVAGAVVSFSGPAGFDPARHLLGGVPARSQTTGADGLYQFYLQNDFPAGEYKLVVSTYPAPYVPAESVRIPACVAAVAVGALPNPALVQRSDTAPALRVPAHDPAACMGMVAGGVDTTQYYTRLIITPNSAPILNNHIPLDPTVAAGLALTKTGDKQQVEFGETLGYTVTVKQSAGTPVAQASVRDSVPAGFTLVPGTVKVNGKPVADPKLATGPVLVFNLGPLSSGKVAVLTYRLRAGVGSLQGDGINRAIAYACATASGCIVPETAQPVARAVPSNTGSYKVRLMAGVFTEQACVAGKVFIDCNNNHVQDSEELGVPGVRLYLEDGTAFSTDVEGKFSFCGLSPKSHVIKADSLTLPRGSRLTTTSSRNLGDAGSLWLDAKNGELLRADFAIGSCSAAVIEQTKARRAQGGSRAVETEKQGLPGLKFNSKAAAAPRQATDSANQELVKPRQGTTPAVPGASYAQ